MPSRLAPYITLLLLGIYSLFLFPLACAERRVISEEATETPLPPPSIESDITPPASNPSAPLHVPTWASPKKHGSAAKGDQKKLCQGCHGEDLRGGTSGVSCYQCHEIFPHESDWGIPEKHGKIVLEKGTSACMTECHETETSCTSCHADFPHLDPNWMGEARNSGHAKTFIHKTNMGDLTACSKCHGADYSRNLGEKSCTSCHRFGVTHQEAWAAGSGHGKYFSEHFTALTSETLCKKCHGEPLGFDDSQTVDLLEGQSDCYICHRAYPHQSYDSGTAPVLTPTLWEPVITSLCGSTRVVGNWAHAYYVFNNPLMGSEASTCGGASAGSCHFDGHRAYNNFRVPPGGSCSYCHKADRPPAPPLLSCDGPPPVSVEKDGPPTILSVTPANGATDVDATIGGLIIQFDEAMRRESILQEGTLILKPTGSTPSSISIHCAEDWCRTATISPNSRLLAGTVYEVRITTQAKDWSGHSLAEDFVANFTTRDADTTAPQIIAVNPTEGATLFCAPNGVSVNFNEIIDPASVSGAIRLSPTDYRNTCRTRCSQRNHCNWVRLSCDRPLSYDKPYSVTVKTTITDLAGNHLDSEKRWSFTIGPYDPKCDE